MSTTNPSPLPFLLLGLVTGGALLYVSYWVWPPGQRRSSDSSENRRQRRQARRQQQLQSTSNSSGSGQGTTLRRSNATRRSSRRRQQQQPTAARRDDNRHYTSDGSSSEEEEALGGRFRNDTDEDGETTDYEYASLVDEEGYEKLQMEDLGDSNHDGLQLMNLLYAIAEDQAVKGGITCNSCRTVPIRGLRYKCANCQDYDLCEGCEAAEVHIKSHVFMKIRIPIPPLANSRTRKLTPFYPGIPQVVAITPEHLLPELLKDTHFDNVELDAMYNQYLSLSTYDQEGGGITRLTFEQALGPLGLEKNLITERIFRFFDQDGDGIINFKEMACGLSVLCKGNFDEKIDFAFQGYDLDGDGYISREELHEMFKAYFYLSMELIRDVVKSMENDLMNNFEYQPGQPISSTFTAPIPREIGVRNNNNSNSSNNNNNNNSISINSDFNSNTHSVNLDTPPNHNESAFQEPRNRQEENEVDRDISEVPQSISTETEEASPLVPELENLEAKPEEEEVAIELTASGHLPAGTYGLVGADVFADDEDDEDEDNGEEEVEAERAGSKQDMTTDISPDVAAGAMESQSSVIERHQETVDDISEAEDSGVDSNSWNAADVLESTSSASVPVRTEAATSITEDTPSITTVLEQPLSVPVSAPRPRSREESTTYQDGGSSSSSGGSRNRIRKDQPLPSLPPSPHLMTPSSSDNPAWERPHRRTLTSASATSDRYVNGSSSLGGADSSYGSMMTPRTTASVSSAASTSTSAHAPVSSSLSANANGNDVVSYSSSSSSAPPITSGSYANPSYFSSTFPVMESLSQDAIQEMVEKTFSAIKNPLRPGFITLEEFRAYVLTDAGILGWFDALGSIF
ncbi:hypothetical protein BGZ83_010838 [Gryganskiella cystojenkinii]|nr:hypothetical protein BGZ83_010838 [Gryganskiella cystojenkinii]